MFEGLIIEETVHGSNGYTIKYIYDDSNLLLGFIYNNITYYYQRTLTGEIARIVDETGNVEGEYIYDAYGNILNINQLTPIAQINPYRYKGYYYDQETNLYYCKSRYYSPEIYRWISRDEIEYLDTSSITGCNLYVYCNSNPVMNYFENNDINGLNTHAKKEPDKLNNNLIIELLEYMIIFDDSNDKQPISSSSQRIPTKIFGSDVPHIKKENNFWKNTASAVIENLDPMHAGGSTYGIINNFFGGHSGGGGYVNGIGDDDLVDIILAMNLW